MSATEGGPWRETKKEIYFEFVVGVYFCVVTVFHMQNFGSHCTLGTIIKKQKQKQKQKQQKQNKNKNKKINTVSPLSDPASRRASMNKQAIFFFFWLNDSLNNCQVKRRRRCDHKTVHYNLQNLETMGQWQHARELEDRKSLMPQVEKP